MKRSTWFNCYNYRQNGNFENAIISGQRNVWSKTIFSMNTFLMLKNSCRSIQKVLQEHVFTTFCRLRGSFHYFFLLARWLHHVVTNGIMIELVLLVLYGERYPMINNSSVQGKKFLLFYFCLEYHRNRYLPKQ